MRQALLRSIYPLIMWLGRMFRPAQHIQLNQQLHPPKQSFWGLQALDHRGKPVDFGSLRGRWVMVVNTASYCGYTHQLAELTALQKMEENQLSVLAFPSNEFKHQEPQTNEAIATFCQRQYGVTFQLMEKTNVLPAAMQHPVYQWLTDPGKNGWCSQPPVWNFGKYLISPEGLLMGFFAQSVSPKEVWEKRDN